MKVFNERINAIFDKHNTDYEAMNQLMTDLALGREMFDAEAGREITKAEAEDKIRQFSLDVLGITDIKNKKQVNRAIRDNGQAWFDIIADTVDVAIEVGFQGSDWFNMVAETKNIKYGDRQDFYIEDDALLSISKAGVSHHDHIIQTIKGGKTETIPTSLYVVKVGADINRYVVGQVNWTKLIEAIAKSYEAQIQEEVCSQIDNVASKLPSTSNLFVGNGTLSAASKDNFDGIIDNVSAANNGADIVLMGSRAALAKINKIADTNWGATAQKDNVMNTSTIGIYNGAKMMIVPNRFKDKTWTAKVFSTNKIFILPVIGDAGKFVKFVDEGDTEILEKTNRGDYTSDIQTYEVQRHMGVGTVLGRMIGVWTNP